MVIKCRKLKILHEPFNRSPLKHFQINSICFMPYWQLSDRPWEKNWAISPLKRLICQMNERCAAAAVAAAAAVDDSKLSNLKLETRRTKDQKPPAQTCMSRWSPPPCPADRSQHAPEPRSWTHAPPRLSRWTWKYKKGQHHPEPQSDVWWLMPM